MVNRNITKRDRIRRRVRSKISGTPQRPRLSVFKSSKHIYAQLIDDKNAVTLAHASTLSPDLKELLDGKAGLEKAKLIGLKIAEFAKESNIETCVYDRSGYTYHGIVKEVAEGAREGGLKF
ncbi:MAG: 50S ribosomal protein L18 [Candidatus Cyclonatronum sp.]|uniref:50S ribosomal protein L18 n=1 Tax=Cyclonatronum sp. TaxID=3024185 RepID=UPI0025C4FCBF|nr:50S ribosomal protein L18 [Cyclonatronum sp.]MCC5935007.1 50S ribosomal protein L18 [Balneolales bacterium]MCH8487447.1 50S ribosomal protein L18 [Cyclonatronum sp.]